MPLTEADLRELHGLLTAPVTTFDCGTLCAPGNGGVPVCCHAASVLPVLYRAELAMLRRRSDLWRRHVPAGLVDPQTQAALRPCETFAVCRGHQHCERHNRSLACRTFPFEPYLDHDGHFVGLVFAYDQTHLCPLITSGHAIGDDFVAQCCAMYRRLFELAPEEKLLYQGTSRTLRRLFGRLRAPIPVLTGRGTLAMPTHRRRRNAT